MQVLASLDSGRALRRDMDDLRSLVSTKRCDICQHLAKVSTLLRCAACHRMHCFECQEWGLRATEYDIRLPNAYTMRWYCQQCKRARTI